MRRGLGAPALLACALATACAAPGPVPDRAAGRDIPLVPDSKTVRGLLPSRATMAGFLRGHLGNVEAAEAAVAAAARVLDLRRLRAGQPFVLERTLDGRVREFAYEVDGDQLLTIRGDDTGALDARLVPIPKVREEATLGAAIDREAPSLFAALDAAREKPELAIAMAEIFSGEIDFNSDLQPGDRFALVYEKFTRDGEAAGYGPIAAALFENGGRVLRAYRYTVPGGRAAYYDEHGRSLKRFFLKSPLRFEPRITSGFSAARFHPVLHQVRAHLGVDYGAPIGAPVVAVAGGVVVSMTIDGANGRMVRLRHASGYETYYLHLSAFATGLRAGRRVDQGETIGKVGMSGLASGPHLDFRIRKNGAFVNPVRERRNLPPGEPIAPGQMRAFAEARDRIAARLDAARLPAPTRPSAVSTAVAADAQTASAPPYERR